MAAYGDRLPLQEVARELDRSLEQIRRYVREGKLPAQKLGMQWFVERGSLEAFKGAIGRSPDKDVLIRAKRLRETIRNDGGILNVVELLEQTRRNHP